MRAPNEFAQGSAPGAVNLPILDDEERRRIGVTYKQQGQAAAVKLGHKLVTGELKAQRVKSWQAHLSRQDSPTLFCWRGGMRSQIAQQWLTEAGTPCTRIAGGFKAIRHFCLNQLNQFATDKQWMILGGMTGSGKTKALERIDFHLDLEALAHHRGSAFGALATPQPTPVLFENLLAQASLLLADGEPESENRVLVEDESRTIGRLALPESWFTRMKQAPVVLLETTKQDRVENIVQEYVIEPLQQGIAADQLHYKLQLSLAKIQKRLGGVNYAAIKLALENAFPPAPKSATKSDARVDANAEWVELLLAHYYDPMYKYQLKSKRPRIIFRGDRAAVAEFCRTYQPLSG